MGWLTKLKERWNLKSGWQLAIILIVFACTGFTVLFLKRPVVDFFTEEGATSIWFSVAYYVLILPIYYVFLLFYGFIFGQFSFFWGFIGRTFKRMSGKKKQ